MNRIVFFRIVVCGLLGLACLKPTASTNRQAGRLAEITPSSSSAPETGFPETRLLSELAISSERLDYEGFTVRKTHRKVRIYGEPIPVKVTDAVLEKNGKRLFSFDGCYFPLGSAVEFGLFPFLKQEKKQIFVSQTIHRGGRHWIVDVPNGAHVVFDSWKYGDSSEELRLADIDGDGNIELLLSKVFWGISEKLSMAESPSSEIVFKYDEPSRTYLPANHRLQSYSLRGIRLDSISEGTEKERLANAVDVWLACAYAGREQDGLKYFEKAYPYPDGETIKSRVRRILETDSAYAFVNERKRMLETK